MRVDPRQARELLHRCASGALGTLSLNMPGYPFVTLLPYVLDAEATPLILVSDLAEHTRNLRGDSRASLMVAEPSRSPLEAPRVTLLGDAVPISMPPAAVDRFMRYLPDATSYLSLGDFRFYRLAVRRIRLVGGFARMGWIEAPSHMPPATLAPSTESDCIRELEDRIPEGWRTLGVDVEGVDLADRDGARRRLAFPSAVCEPDALIQAVLASVDGIADPA